MKMLSRMVLARQYFLLMLGLGTLLVLAGSSWELWRYYKVSEQQMQQLDARVTEIYQHGLVSNLNLHNTEQIQNILNTIVEFEAVEEAQLLEAYTSWQVGEEQNRAEPDYQLALVFTGESDPTPLGQLSLFYEKRGGPLDLFYKGLALLFYGAAKLIIMLGFAVFFFHTLVSRYVVAIDEHLRNLNPEKGVQLLRFPSRRLATERNEFDSVIATINILNYRLVESVRELRLHGAQLEQRVVERTQALEKANERALRNERLSAIGQLVGKVSHELRNPLGTIQASLALLQRGGGCQ